MRTTVTLDDDLAVRLQRLSQEQGRSFKAVINEAIRTGLGALQAIPTQRVPSEPAGYTKPVDLGPPARPELLPSQQLAALAEGEDTASYRAADVPG